jgi:hypothetical protein
MLEYRSPPRRPGFGFDALGKVTVVGLSFVAGLPGGFLLYTYACYLSAARYLGYFPTYGRPDPGTLPAGVMFGNWLISFGLALTVLVVLVICLVMIRSSPIRLWVALGCAVLLWALFIADPVGAFNWRAD